VNLSYTEIRVLYLKLRADCTILQQHMNRNIQEGRMLEESVPFAKVSTCLSVFGVTIVEDLDKA
jgi:hypothetical protein